MVRDVAADVDHEIEPIGSDKAKSLLLEKKSHEIRTYMTRIISMTDLTLMTELTEEQVDYLTIVKSSTRLLLKVLTDVMDYSKILEGKVDLDQVPFDLRVTILEVVEMFQVAAKQKNITLSLHTLEGTIPENLLGDPIRLKQVLSNLVANSIKFTHQGEVTLQVTLEEHDDSKVKIKFQVSDSGVGISENLLLKLNGILNKRDDSNLQKLGGSGLSIAQKLVELLDGKIHVASKEGVGSNVCFTAVFEVQGEGGGLHRNKNRSGRR